MKNRKIALLLAVALLIGLFAAACGPASTTTSTPPAESKAPTEEPADDPTETPTETPTEEPADEPTEEPADDPSVAVPAFEDIVFPDSLPKVPQMADNSLYAYDDMTEKYTVEFLTHHYGQPALPKDQDVVLQWLQSKFNLDITLTAVNQADLDTVLSTRYSGADEPDVMYTPNRDMAFQLSDQGLLWDAKLIYPYMPQRTTLVTKNMITWSTNKANGEIPFVTTYGIQDGTWGFCIRKDWMEKFGITKEPTTKAELLAYAKACVENDPDGNGQADTYFMAGAGEGRAFGMLDGFASLFGNPASHVEDGKLAHPYFDGDRKEFLSFLKELNDAGYLIPDWYTIAWEPNKANTMNDKLGMVWYPAGTLIAEYVEAKKSPENNNKPMEALSKWHVWKDSPIEGGKYGAAGNPGYNWAFSKRKVESEGEMMRIAHMMDTMLIGGENFFQSIQGSTDEVYIAAGIEVKNPRKTEYLPDGTFYLSNEYLVDDEGNQITYPYGINDGFGPVGIWQHFGLGTGWQISDPNKTDPFEAQFAKEANEYNQIIANGYERWPNDGLLVSLSGAAAEAQATNLDWVYAQEYAFVSGGRSLDEYDAFCQEWLDKGGKAIIAQIAECLGVPVPDYAA